MPRAHRPRPETCSARERIRFRLGDDELSVHTRYRDPVSRFLRHWLALDVLVALALGAPAQVAVWEGHVAGPRLLIAPLFLLVGPPLVVRRRLPLAPLVAL